MTKTLINTFGTRFYHKEYKDFIKGRMNIVIELLLTFC